MVTVRNMACAYGNMCHHCAMHRIVASTAIFALSLLAALPTNAQDTQEAQALFGGTEPRDTETVFDDTWLAIGFGVRINSSYDGSDDYVTYALPALAGSIEGIEFSPRAAGLAVTLLETDLSRNVEFTAGPVGRLRANRVRKIKDPVVAAAGKLDTAVELGVDMGLTFKRVLTKYDRISIGTDVRWDVAGAHSGFVLDPGIAYRTPLSRGIVLGLSAGGQYADGEYMRYYYSVTPIQSAGSGLPQFSANAGWFKAGGAVALGVDLDGNLDNGGFVLGVLAGYSRMLGDAARSPYTSIRGDADQFHVAGGVGFIF